MICIDKIKAFAEHIGLPEEAQIPAVPLSERIFNEYPEEYAAIREKIQDKEQIYALAEKINKEQDLVMLAVCLLLGIDAEALYRERGIAEDIYWASMRDITIWTKTCMKMRGHVGLYEYGWITSFLTASIVRLHRLEFHIISFMDNKTWSKAGVTVNGGDPVINIHIPEDGPLLPEDVIESFRRAYRYFNCTGIQAFVCHSWLLYPGNYEFLSETSNIRKFMDNFDLITRDEYQYSSDLWRVFGPCPSYRDTSVFPRDTGLQRGMIRYLDEHDFTSGSGYGIFLFDGEHIVK